MTASGLDAFLAAHARVVAIRLERVRGSAPRAEGTEMYVAPDAVLGTIGGGEMEFRAILAAREVLGSGRVQTRLDLALGPEIGQCCGGRVQIALDVMDSMARKAALGAAARQAMRRPHTLILGAGHVGRALAQALAPLPVDVALIDQRQRELDACAAPVAKHLSAVPEEHVQSAPPGSAFLVVTHDHGLDFLLTAEALARGDAAYVGLIGSATKRAAFRSWLSRTDPEQSDATLTCPIGARGLGDKRPEVIAAHTVPEVLTALGKRSGS